MPLPRCFAARSCAALLSGLIAGCAPSVHTPGAQPVAAALAEPAPKGPIRHVVLVTVDGLVPDSYLHPDEHKLRVPTLRRLVQEGAFSAGALSAFPSLTYPSHTSIATGTQPSRHGIVSNRRSNPLEKEGWSTWYAEEIRAKPLWQVVEEAHYRAAVINWPVSLGAHASWYVPAYYGAVPEQLRLVRALSTPGLVERTSQRFPDHASRALDHLSDQAVLDLVEQVLSEGSPELLMLHIGEVDHAQHEHGLWSAEALTAIEVADQQLARLITLISSGALAGSTALVVASDHGFTDTQRQLNPNTWLREAGLIDVNDQGEIATFRANVVPSGGLAYLYVPSEHAASAADAERVVRQRAGQTSSGIAHIYSREEIAHKGGDPSALLALGAELGSVFGPGAASYEGKPVFVAGHGYDPERPEMHASLLLLGPSIRPGEIQGARLVDIAPTIAKWLNLDLPNAEGRALW